MLVGLFEKRKKIRSLELVSTVYLAKMVPAHLQLCPEGCCGRILPSCDVCTHSGVYIDIYSR